jgi:gamma-glutamylaminecyclotransferase
VSARSTRRSERPPARDAELRTRVFVYGTLLAGECNHRHLVNARLVAEVKTEPAFRLYDLGPFPGLVAVGSDAVIGEVYEVEEPTLAMLDQLEGHPRFYVRKSIVLESGALVQTYLLMPHQVVGRPIIASGSWRAHTEGTST